MPDAATTACPEPADHDLPCPAAERAWWRRVFRPRLLGALVIAVLVIELCVRIDEKLTYDAPLLGAYELDTLYTFDALGRHGRPHARYRKWRLNALGYRGPELRPRLANDRRAGGVRGLRPLRAGGA